MVILVYSDFDGWWALSLFGHLEDELLHLFDVKIFRSSGLLIYWQFINVHHYWVK